MKWGGLNREGVFLNFGCDGRGLLERGLKREGSLIELYAMLQASTIKSFTM